MSILEENIERTEVSDLGEFGLIERLTTGVKIKNKSTIKGIGDDSAVLNYGNKQILITKDLLIEGVHFDMTYAPLMHLGYKAAVVNISDVVAMNGKPKQLVIGMGISNRFSVEAIEEIYEGIYLACEKYGVDVIGGDTVSSRSGLVISITCLGEAAKSDVVYRNKANKGDLIFVSGNLGAAYMGLLVLEREKQAFKADPNMQPDLAGHDYILSRQLKPEARVDILDLLKEAGVKPTSMIDISDGLASDLLHICEQSKLGCSIYEDKLPIDVTTAQIAQEFKIEPVIAALNGGEDYELLFTVKQEDYDRIKGLKEIAVIGHMEEESAGRHMISQSGTQITLRAQGWDAFLRKDDDKEFEGNQ